jgi:hypothetical protein
MKTQSWLLKKIIQNFKIARVEHQMNCGDILHSGPVWLHQTDAMNLNLVMLL